MSEAMMRLPDNLADDIEAYQAEVTRFLAGDLAPGIFKARRVPRGVYEQRQDGAYMARVRVAGGVLSVVQAQQLAKLAKTFSDGRLHVTTRQDVQLHDLTIEDTPAIMRELMTVGLTTKGGGGNTVRNVAACPYAGVCPAEQFDVTPYAQAVTTYLIGLEGSYNLPRKYKVAFSGCAVDCALAGVCDVGFIAEMREGQRGFRLKAGGGMGALPRIADAIEDWVPATDVIRIAEAFRRLFDQYGDRHNRQRARLRFVFEKLGLDKVKQVFDGILADVCRDGVPTCDVTPEIAERPVSPASLGELVTMESGYPCLKQRQSGYESITLALPLGFVEADDFARIAEVADTFSQEHGVRTSREQRLIIRFVPTDRRDELLAALQAVSVDVRAGAMGRMVACAGASTCRLGLCLSRRAAAVAADKLASVSGIEDLTDGFRVYISGCSNACGHHPIAPLGFFGVAKRLNGRLLPAYRVMVAGRAGPRPQFGTAVGTVSAREVPELAEAVFSDFTSSRKASEPFVAYVDRVGVPHIEAIVARYPITAERMQAPEFYRDWCVESDFSLAGRGAGECGAGVFEVIQTDLDLATRALERHAETGDDVSLLEALLGTTRALLITRGIDAQAPLEVFDHFETQFVDGGLVDPACRDLLRLARQQVRTDGVALGDRGEAIAALLARVDLLYRSLDASLVFHPPEETANGVEADGRTEDAGKDDVTTVEIDLSGVACPMNYVKAKLRVEMMEQGDILDMVLDDGAPVQNVPASFENDGQEILSIEQQANGQWNVLLKKRV